MKNGLVVIICGLSCFSAALLFAAGQDNAPSKNDGKVPIVESGFITKIDLKKKMLIIQGYVFTPLPEEGGPSQKTGSPNGARNFDADGQGGRGGRGRPSGAPSGGGNGRGNSSDPVREFDVYVQSNTMIQDDKVPLTLNDLKDEDFVVVLGIPRGKSLNVDASSITVSNR